jgi:hypothetical protein
MPRANEISITCVCGRRIKERNMDRHLDSAIHMNLMQQQQLPNVEPQQQQHVEQPQLPQYPVSVQYQSLHPPQQPAVSVSTNYVF